VDKKIPQIVGVAVFWLARGLHSLVGYRCISYFSPRWWPRTGWVGGHDKHNCMARKVMQRVADLAKKLIVSNLAVVCLVIGMVVAC